MLIGVTKYNQPLVHPYLYMAEKEYDRITDEEIQKIRNKYGAEADAKGLKRKDKGQYIKKAIDPFEAKRLAERDATVKKRIEELKIEIPEALKKYKKVGDLEPCKIDLELFLNFGTQVMGAKPEDIIVLATESLF